MRGAVKVDDRRYNAVNERFTANNAAHARFWRMNEGDCFRFEPDDFDVKTALDPQVYVKKRGSLFVAV
jgi:hypothetical protein